MKLSDWTGHPTCGELRIVLGLFTYCFTGIFPVLSTCKHNFVCTFCRKCVVEPFNCAKLYANFISSSVQCWNELKENQNEISCRPSNGNEIIYIFEIKYKKCYC